MLCPCTFLDNVYGDNVHSRVHFNRVRIHNKLNEGVNLDMYSMKCHSVSYKTFCTNISKVLQVNDTSDNVMIESHDFIYSSGALQWLLVKPEFMRYHVIVIMVTDDRNRKLWNNIHIVKSVDNKYRLHLLAKNRPKIAELRKESCTSILCTSQCNWILCSLALYHHRESLSLSR